MTSHYMLADKGSSFIGMINLVIVPIQSAMLDLKMRHRRLTRHLIPAFGDDLRISKCRRGIRWQMKRNLRVIGHVRRSARWVDRESTTIIENVF